MMANITAVANITAAVANTTVAVANTTVAGIMVAAINGMAADTMAAIGMAIAVMGTAAGLPGSAITQLPVAGAATVGARGIGRHAAASWSDRFGSAHNRQAAMLKKAPARPGLFLFGVLYLHRHANRRAQAAER